MSKLKMSPEELEAANLKFQESDRKRKEDELRAVEEMLKHPMSLEQIREQIRRTHAEADRLEKRGRSR